VETYIIVIYRVHTYVAGSGLPGGHSVTNLVHSRTIADVRLDKTGHHLNHTNLTPTCHRLLNCMIIRLNRSEPCYIYIVGIATGYGLDD
jgi:hypothetical protein